VFAVSPRAPLAVCLVVAAFAVPAAQQRAPTDLDRLMSRVLERRDENWKKLQQYVLEERESFQVIGPGGVPLYGSARESAWFPRDGIFIKSPLRVDGVTISDTERRKAEAEWVANEQKREKRDKERAAKTAGAEAAQQGAGDAPLTEEGVRQALEPGFVSAAYFLKFKFDPGQYALAGREMLEGRQVLRIEYYPTKLFNEGRSRPNRKVRERDADVTPKMNKVALVTLWVDPAAYQILKFEFSNLPWDFLPGRSIIRVDGVTARMEMGQPFPDVWLPRAIRVGFDFTIAIGEVDGRYATDYHDYRLASVTSRIR
jgi:hypothetical protein